MQNKAVRLHGTLDLRLDTFSIPEIKPDELLLHIVCDSLCMSSYKATALGSGHKRVPDDIDVHPIIVGHEFCGKLPRWVKTVVTGTLLDKEFLCKQRFLIPMRPRATRMSFAAETANMRSFPRPIQPVTM